MIEFGHHQLIDWTLRASLLMAATAIFAFALRNRAPSSIRHALWALVITACLGLPLLSLTLPEWGILPARASVTMSSASLDPAAVSDRMTVTIPSNLQSNSAPHGEPSSGTDATLLVEKARWSQILIIGWFVGASFCLIRLLLAHGSLAVLVRYHSRENPQLSDRYQRRIRTTERNLPPMVCGLLRPTILLPISALTWPGDRLQAVLEHEQAHIRRGDLIWGWLARLLVSLQWFNPLVWFAAAQMRRESEHACDDAVILNGTPAKDYARHLLEVASMLERTLRSLPAAAMASAQEVEYRLCHALDENRSRRPLGRRTSFLFALLLTPLACALALASEAEAEPPKEKVVEPKAEAEQAPARKVRTIVLDPGHGGKDSGFEGTPGSAEKDLTLKLALALRERLEKSGLRVVLTRFDDSFVSLDQRLKIANKELDAAMISLHFDQIRQLRGKRYVFFIPPTASHATTHFAAVLTDTMKAKLPQVDIQSRLARLKMIEESLIPSVSFEIFKPALDVADTEFDKIADLLASGIVAWSKLPPPILPKAELAKDSLDISADNVDYNAAGQLIEARGNVLVQITDDSNLKLQGPRSDYSMDKGTFKIWKATATFTQKDDEISTCKAGLIEHDTNAGTLKLSSGFQIIQGRTEVISKDDKTIATIEIATGKLRLEGPTQTRLLQPKE